MGSLQKKNKTKQQKQKQPTPTIRTHGEAILEDFSAFKNYIITLVRTISKYYCDK